MIAPIRDDAPWPIEPVLHDLPGRPGPRPLTGAAVTPQAPKPARLGLSLADFLNEPDDRGGDDLVAGLLPRCGLAVLAGDPKAFKTLLALQLALTVGRPTDGPATFLGRPAERGAVLVIEEEGSRSRLRERFRLMMAGLGYTGTALVTVAMHSGLRLDNPRDRERLEAAIVETGAVLVVGDPFIFLHSKDENRPTEMAGILRELAALAARRRCCFLLVHHLTKPSAERRVTRLAQRVRGAGAIPGGTDANIVLDRDSGAHTARLRAELRDGEDVDLALELDVSTLLLRVIQTPVRAGKIPEDALAFYVREAGSVTSGDVAKQFRVSPNCAKDALFDLVDRGVLDSYQDARKWHHFLARGNRQ